MCGVQATHAHSRRLFAGLWIAENALQHDVQSLRHGVVQCWKHKSLPFLSRGVFVTDGGNVVRPVPHEFL